MRGSEEPLPIAAAERGRVRDQREEERIGVPRPLIRRRVAAACARRAQQQLEEVEGAAALEARAEDRIRREKRVQNVEDGARAPKITCPK